ncbi:MAG: Bug family tripartite tricarboxylate transporter substrate binding protein [Alphaproteobacteria bacterium]
MPKIHAGLGALALAAIAAIPDAATAQSVADFYKGKQIEFIIGSAAGSTYDAWARVIGRHMGRHIAGKPTFLPKNMPGAGHIKATNYLFNVAPKDGTSIGMFSRNMPTRALLNHPAVKFKPEEFNWIGSPELTNRLCVAMANAPVQSGDDLFTKELIVGGAGSGGAVSTTPLILKGVLGMKFKLVEGYKGTADIFLAMERGELHGVCHSLSGLRAGVPGWLESGKIRVLFNMERKPIPGVNAPTIYKYIKTPEQRQVVSFYTSNTELGRPIAVPPGVPAGRLTALRRAFDATMKDPGFTADANKQKLEINALTGEELTERVLDLAKTPAAIVDRTEALLGVKPKKKKKKKKSE